MKTSRKLHSLLALAGISVLFLAVVGSMATSVAAQAEPVTQENACVVYGTSTETTDPATSATEQAAEAVATETADQPEMAAATPETNQAQDPSFSGSIAVDETAMDKLSEADKCAAFSKAATVTADQAKATVEQTGGVVDSIELDEENGFLVYSVQLHDGTDVKVDAGNGTILNTQPAGADNGASDGENG